MSLSNLQLYNRMNVPLYPRPTVSSQRQDEISHLKSRIGTLEKELKEKTIGWLCPKCDKVHSPYEKYCVCLTDLKLL